MPIEDYQYLWDGSQPGWSLTRFEHVEWSVTFHFANSGATKADIVALRKLIADLQQLPASTAYRQLAGCPTYTLPNTLGNLAMRELVAEAERLGLSTSTQSVDRGGYLPVFRGQQAHALLIEDEELLNEVTQRMLAANVPVTTIHVD